jgi:ribosomal protein L11 methyltransferase
LVSKGGDLVLSGILEEQAESVMTAYQPFISIAEPVQQEDWIRLEGIRH